QRPCPAIMVNISPWVIDPLIRTLCHISGSITPYVEASGRLDLPRRAHSSVQREDRGENVRAAVTADEADGDRLAGVQAAVAGFADRLDVAAGLGPLGAPAAVEALPGAGPGEGEGPAVDRGAGVGDLDVADVPAGPVRLHGQGDLAGAGGGGGRGEGQRRR